MQDKNSDSFILVGKTHSLSIWLENGDLYISSMDEEKCKVVVESNLIPDFVDVLMEFQNR
jgi:hypothetical protein